MNKMKMWLAIVTVAALVLPVFAKEDEKGQKVEWKKVPAAVQATIQKRAPGAKVLEVEKEIEKGKVVYEALVKAADGTITEIELSEDGKVLEFDVKSGGTGKKK